MLVLPFIPILALITQNCIAMSSAFRNQGTVTQVALQVCHFMFPSVGFSPKELLSLVYPKMLFYVSPIQKTDAERYATSINS